MLPSYQIERELGAPQKRIAGVDEVGRGALAGDVVAAAVILDARQIPEGVNDSKKLSRKKRETLASAIRSTAAIGIGRASAADIDRDGIVAATFAAMKQAVAALPQPPDTVLIDGNRLPDGLGLPARAIIGGDGIALSIAAASIIAKVARDAEMRALAQHCQLYGWENNVGYGTAEHLAALRRHGPSPHHRRSFKGV